MDISKLKPTDETASACRASLDRITAAMAETDAAIVQASTRRDNLMLEGSGKEIRKAEQDLADGQLDLDRLKLLDDRVRAQLAGAEADERKAAIRADHAALIPKIADHVAELDRVLPKVAKQLREILARDASIRAECFRINALTANSPELPALAAQGAWRMGTVSVPETRAEHAEWLAATVAKRADEERELAAIRYEQAEAQRRRFEEQGALDREREAGPRLETVGRVVFAPTGGPIIRTGGTR